MTWQQLSDIAAAQASNGSGSGGAALAASEAYLLHHLWPALQQQGWASISTGAAEKEAAGTLASNHLQAMAQRAPGSYYLPPASSTLHGQGLALTSMSFVVSVGALHVHWCMIASCHTLLF